VFGLVFGILDPLLTVSHTKPNLVYVWKLGAQFRGAGLVGIEALNLW